MASLPRTTLPNESVSASAGSSSSILLHDVEFGGGDDHPDMPNSLGWESAQTNRKVPLLHFSRRDEMMEKPTLGAGNSLTASFAALPQNSEQAKHHQTYYRPQSQTSTDETSVQTNPISSNQAAMTYAQTQTQLRGGKPLGKNGGAQTLDDIVSNIVEQQNIMKLLLGNVKQQIQNRLIIAEREVRDRSGLSSDIKNLVAMDMQFLENHQQLLWESQERLQQQVNLFRDLESKSSGPGENKPIGMVRGNFHNGKLDSDRTAVNSQQPNDVVVVSNSGKSYDGKETEQFKSISASAQGSFASGSQSQSHFHINNNNATNNNSNSNNSFKSSLIPNPAVEHVTGSVNAESMVMPTNGNRRPNALQLLSPGAPHSSASPDMSGQIGDELQFARDQELALQYSKLDSSQEWRSQMCVQSPYDHNKYMQFYDMMRKNPQARTSYSPLPSPIGDYQWYMNRNGIARSTSGQLSNRDLRSSFMAVRTSGSSNDDVPGDFGPKVEQANNGASLENPGGSAFAGSASKTASHLANSEQNVTSSVYTTTVKKSAGVMRDLASVDNQLSQLDLNRRGSDSNVIFGSEKTPAQAPHLESLQATRQLITGARFGAPVETGKNLGDAIPISSKVFGSSVPSASPVLENATAGLLVTANGISRSSSRSSIVNMDPTSADSTARVHKLHTEPSRSPNSAPPIAISQGQQNRGTIIMDREPIGFWTVEGLTSGAGAHGGNAFRQPASFANTESSDVSNSRKENGALNGDDIHHKHDQANMMTSKSTVANNSYYPPESAGVVDQFVDPNSHHKDSNNSKNYGNSNSGSRGGNFASAGIASKPLESTITSQGLANAGIYNTDMSEADVAQRIEEMELEIQRLRSLSANSKRANDQQMVPKQNKSLRAETDSGATTVSSLRPAAAENTATLHKRDESSPQLLDTSGQGNSAAANNNNCKPESMMAKGGDAIGSSSSAVTHNNKVEPLASSRSRESSDMQPEFLATSPVARLAYGGADTLQDLAGAGELEISLPRESSQKKDMILAPSAPLQLKVSETPASQGQLSSSSSTVHAHVHPGWIHGYTESPRTFTAAAADIVLQPIKSQQLSKQHSDMREAETVTVVDFSDKTQNGDNVHVALPSEVAAGTSTKWQPQQSFASPSDSSGQPRLSQVLLKPNRQEISQIVSKDSSIANQESAGSVDKSHKNRGSVKSNDGGGDEFSLSSSAPTLKFHSSASVNPGLGDLSTNHMLNLLAQGNANRISASQNNTVAENLPPASASKASPLEAFFNWKIRSGQLDTPNFRPASSPASDRFPSASPMTVNVSLRSASLSPSQEHVFIAPQNAQKNISQIFERANPSLPGISNYTRNFHIQTLPEKQLNAVHSQVTSQTDASWSWVNQTHLRNQSIFTEPMSGSGMPQAMTFSGSASELSPSKASPGQARFSQVAEHAESARSLTAAVEARLPNEEHSSSKQQQQQQQQRSLPLSARESRVALSEARLNADRQSQSLHNDYQRRWNVDAPQPHSYSENRNGSSASSNLTNFASTSTSRDFDHSPALPMLSTSNAVKNDPKMNSAAAASGHQSKTIYSRIFDMDMTETAKEKATEMEGSAAGSAKPRSFTDKKPTTLRASSVPEIAKDPKSYDSDIQRMMQELKEIHSELSKHIPVRGVGNNYVVNSAGTKVPQGSYLSSTGNKLLKRTLPVARPSYNPGLSVQVGGSGDDGEGEKHVGFSNPLVSLRSRMKETSQELQVDADRYVAAKSMLPSPAAVSSGSGNSGNAIFGGDAEIDEGSNAAVRSVGHPYSAKPVVAAELKQKSVSPSSRVSDDPPATYPHPNRRNVANRMSGGSLSPDAASASPASRVRSNSSSPSHVGYIPASLGLASPSYDGNAGSNSNNNHGSKNNVMQSAGAAPSLSRERLSHGYSPISAWSDRSSGLVAPISPADKPSPVFGVQKSGNGGFGNISFQPFNAASDLYGYASQPSLYSNVQVAASAVSLSNGNSVGEASLSAAHMSVNNNASAAEPALFKAGSGVGGVMQIRRPGSAIGSVRETSNGKNSSDAGVFGAAGSPYLGGGSGDGSGGGVARKTSPRVLPAHPPPVLTHPINKKISSHNKSARHADLIKAPSPSKPAVIMHSRKSQLNLSPEKSLQDNKH